MSGSRMPRERRPYRTSETRSAAENPTPYNLERPAPQNRRPSVVAQLYDLRARLQHVVDGIRDVVGVHARQPNGPAQAEGTLGQWGLSHDHYGYGGYGWEMGFAQNHIS